VFRLLGIGAIAAAVFKLLIHLYANHNYGYFVDELYYLACARHLAWGYVDQPPLIAFIARISVALFGESLQAIRFLPALAGAGTVLLSGLIARELGGGRFAAGLAALCTLAAPGLLSFQSFLSMNAFEPVFWMSAALVLIRVIKTGDQKLWIWFGLLAGLGLLNKHSMLIFGFSLAAGLLLTPERRVFRKPGIWLAALLSLAIFAPNLWWNAANGFPFLELQANIRASGRNVDLGLAKFLGEVILVMLPLSESAFTVAFASEGMTRFTRPFTVSSEILLRGLSRGEFGRQTWTLVFQSRHLSSQVIQPGSIAPRVHDAKDGVTFTHQARRRRKIRPRSDFAIDRRP